MFTTHRLLIVLLLASSALSPLAHAQAVATTTPSPQLAFTLKDQLDREFTEAYCAGQTALITVADRKGSKFIGAWSNAIGEQLKTTEHPPVKWVGVATLTGIPSLMRGMVKKMFGGNENQWTLMDWRGHFAKTYALPADHSSLLVFAPDGRLVFQASGREVDPAIVQAVVAAIVATSPATPGVAAAK